MYTATMAGFEQVQAQAKESAKTIRDTNRASLRSYLQAAFELQRAGLEAVNALQKGLEELTFNVVEQAENAQDKAAADAEARLQQNVQQLREVSQVVQQNNERTRQRVEEIRASVSQQQSNLQELAQLRATRVREGSEIGIKVAQVIEKRVETVLGDLFQLGRRGLADVDTRIEQLIGRIDSQLSEEIQPIANYDELNVDEIISQLDPLDAIQLRVIRKHETSHKNRVTVLRAIDQKLAEKDAVSEG